MEKEKSRNVLILATLLLLSLWLGSPLVFFYFHRVLSTILTPIITIWTITVTFTLFAVIMCMSKCASLSYNFKKLISFFLYFFSEPQDPGSSDAGMNCTLHSNSNLCIYIIVLYREYNRSFQWINRFSHGGEWRPPIISVREYQAYTLWRYTFQK